MFFKSKKFSGRSDQEYFLHLGLHKTATTALQEFLHKNSKNFLAHDVRYIHLQKMRSDVTPLLATIEKNKRRKLFGLLDTFPNKRILLSDENIIGISADLASGNLYPFAKNRIETFCEQAGEQRVTLFITLREPSAFLTSMYCEYIRHKDFVTFDKFIAHFDVEEFSYAHIFRWIKNLPQNTRVHLIPFESSYGGGLPLVIKTIVEKTAGLNSRIDYNLFPKKKYRTSFSQEEIDLATEIANRAGPKIVRSFLNSLDALDNRFGSNKFSPLPPELATKLESRYADELLTLV